ncbi:MAG: TolC family protein [Ignavibacteriales bacterium]|nr:MAG: TolC family protein [Ignavibacteriales bacterium]
MKSLLKPFVILFFFSVNLYSQTQLTLEDALSIALKESYGIKSAQYSLLSSQKTLEAAKLGLMTSINMEFDLPRYSQTLSSQFNPVTGTEQFFEIGYTTYESRLFFSQPIVFTNGTFSLVGSMWRRDQFNEQQDIPVDYYSNLSLRLSQPLFTFNNLSANLTRAEINLEKSKRNYTRAEYDVIYNVTAGFYQLYQSKMEVEIAKEKVSQTETSYQTAMNKFKAGLIAEVEALQLEIDLASSKNDLLNKERTFKESKDDFKLLIGLQLSEDIDVSAVLEYLPINVDMEEAVAHALENRSEIKNSEADIELRNLNVDEVDSRGNISGQLTANYGINKNDDKFNNIFRDFSKDRGVVFTLSVPVLDWGRNNREVESTQADLDLTKLTYNNQKQQIEKEIISILNKIESAKARVEVLSKSVELAEKSYNISKSRFDAGTITSFDLSQMQLRLTDARTNSLYALIDYKLAVADLTRKTLFDFEKQ